jgi:hypothetical protein
MEFRRPVEISSQAFAFCRYTLTVALWAAFFLKIKVLVLFVWIILVLSAILGITRAPLIVLYSQTLGRFLPASKTELDLDGMRFAHSLGAIFGLMCLLFLYFFSEPIGWGLTLVYAVIKTISAVSVCPAYKLYVCMTSGGSCCSFLRKKG